MIENAGQIPRPLVWLVAQPLRPIAEIITKSVVNLRIGHSLDCLAYLGRHAGSLYRLGKLARDGAALALGDPPALLAKPDQSPRDRQDREDHLNEGHLSAGAPRLDSTDHTATKIVPSAPSIAISVSLSM
jgi:hypothetical protein